MFWWKKFVAHRLQREGTRGQDIAEFQKIFNRRARKMGVSVEETGIYDEETIQAVAKYQYWFLNVPRADGFVGPLTAVSLRIRLIEE